MDQRDWIRVDLDHIPEENRKIADEELALQLLAGYSTNGRTRYLKHNSPEEKLARAALARIVRRKMSGGLSLSGELLALAIDPATETKFVGMKPTRRVRFESLRRGKPST